MQEATELFSLAVALFGDKAGQIIGAVALVGYLWAQIRQIIPARAIARLPKWMIWILEFAAANKYQAENSLYNDPRHHKSLRSDLKGR